MSIIENLLNKCIWTFHYILVLAEFLEEIQKFILQDLRLRLMD